jgi:hypothetical protein
MSAPWWQWTPPADRTVTLTYDFYAAAAASWLWCGATGLLSVRFASRVFGRAFMDLDSSVQAVWHQYTYCLFSGCISCALLVGEVRELFWERALDANFQYNGVPLPGCHGAFGFSMGFLAFDMVVMIIWRKQMEPAMKRSMFLQMMLHHILSIFAWPQALHRGIGWGYVSYCILTESTSLFVNLHWLLRTAKKSGTLFGTVNSVLLAISYLVVRILPIPWVVWCWWNAPKGHWLWVEYAVACILFPLPSLLNLFWFSFIVKGAMALMQGGAKKKDADADTAKAVNGKVE